MHRKDVLRREQVVERGEDRLLDLACVTGAADDDDPPAQVDQDERLTARAVSLRLGLERGQRDHGEIRFEVHQFVRGRPDEQVASKQAVPRELRGHPHAQPEASVGACEDVLRVDAVGGNELLHAAEQLVELGRCDRLVAGMSPDCVMTRRLLDEELVLRRASGVLTGLGGQRARGDDRRFVPADSLLVERGRTQVPPFDGHTALQRHL